MFKKIMLCLSLLGACAYANPDQNMLLTAIENNDIGTVESMISSLPTNPDEAKALVEEWLGSDEYQNKLAFMCAAEAGTPELFRLLLQTAQRVGIDPAEYIREHTDGLAGLLSKAAYGGSLEILEYVYLLIPENERQDIINNMESDDESPLINGAQGGHIEALEWLFQHGADIRLINIPEFIGYSLNVEVVKCLFEFFDAQGESEMFFNSSFNGGETALMRAANNGDVGTPVFMWLIQQAADRGIDIKEAMTRKNEDGENILCLAALGRNPEIVKYVLNSLSEDEKKEEFGSALVKTANIMFFGTKAFMLLAQNAQEVGIDPIECLNQEIENGTNVLELALQKRNIGVVEYLLSNLSVNKCKEMIQSLPNPNYIQPKVRNMLQEYISTH